MKIHLLYTTVFFGLFTSCQQPASISNAGKKEATTFTATAAKEKDTLPLTSHPLCIKANSEIEVQSLNMHVDAKETLCKNWLLTQANVVQILKAGVPISGETWHHVFPVLPCNAAGTVLIDQLRYAYRINAGSHFHIWNADTSYIFGCTQPQTEKFFLMKAENE